MKGLIIHQHGLKIETTRKSFYGIFINNSYQNYKSFYEKDETINLDENLIYNFYCSKCQRKSLNYDDPYNRNYCYMVKPSNSNFIKF